MSLSVLQACLKRYFLKITYVIVDIVKVGANGTGKTTLLKILLGDLRPIDGVHHTHRSLRIGYFSQHHVDQLDMNVSAVQVIEAKFPGLCYYLFCPILCIIG